MEHEYQNIKISGRSSNDSTATGNCLRLRQTGIRNDRRWQWHWRQWRDRAKRREWHNWWTFIIYVGKCITGPTRDGVEEEPDERLVVLIASDRVDEELAEVLDEAWISYI